MDGVKEYVISWLDWATKYARDDPYDFISRCKKITAIFIRHNYIVVIIKCHCYIITSPLL